MPAIFSFFEQGFAADNAILAAARRGKLVSAGIYLCEGATWAPFPLFVRACQYEDGSRRSRICSRACMESALP